MSFDDLFFALSHAELLGFAARVIDMANELDLQTLQAEINNRIADLKSFDEQESNEIEDFLSSKEWGVKSGCDASEVDLY